MSSVQYKWDIVLLTEKRYLDPKERNDYINNLLLDDQILQNALEAKGLKVIRVDWANPSFDWASANYILFRTPWDYFKRFDEFFEWLNKTKTKSTFINSIEIALWNIDKKYLKELSANGVHIVETHFIGKGDSKTLQEHFDKCNWEKAVLKPNISAAAMHTYKLDAKNISEHESVFKQLVKTEDLMLQSFQNNILTEGEVSHMVFDGKHTHSILKIAKQGDFRVQDDFGGSIQDYYPSKDEIKLAEHIVKVSKMDPLYARVDLIKDNADTWALSELELIEPELWFRNNPESAEILGNGIIKKYF